MTKAKHLNVIPYILALIVMMFLGGCGGTTVAPNLLKQPHKTKPIINKSINVTSPINHNIDRAEKVEESIKESLELALNNSNIFKQGTKKQYKLVATTQSFSQAPMSFGKFGNKLTVNYQLYSDNGKLLIEKSIFTIAESDKWLFSGIERSERARAVNIAKNVNQFMDILQKNLI